MAAARDRARQALLEDRVEREFTLWHEALNSTAAISPGFARSLTISTRLTDSSARNPPIETIRLSPAVRSKYSSNIGIERYFDEYFERTAGSTGSSPSAGSRADEIERLIETVNERARPGEIAAIELNASCHNVNFPFATILEESLRRSVPKQPPPRDPQGLPDEDYHGQARLAERFGCAAITAINTVKGLRLDPETGEPYLKNRYGAISARRSSPSACGSSPSSATPASGSRSSPTAGSATSTTAASTSGRAPTRSASGRRPGSSHAALRARAARRPPHPPADRADGGVRAPPTRPRTGSRRSRIDPAAATSLADPAARAPAERGRAPQGVTASTGSGKGPDCRIGASLAGRRVVRREAELELPVGDLAR